MEYKWIFEKTLGRLAKNGMHEQSLFYHGPGE